MSKINLLTIILISSLLNACGFHTPTDVTSLNVSITGKSNNAFATELKKHFDTKAEQYSTVQIGDEVQKQRTAAYDSKAATSSHTLTLSVPVKIFRGKKLLLLKTLTASTTVSEMSTLQANRLQIDASYVQLRNEVVAKLLRILKALK